MGRSWKQHATGSEAASWICEGPIVDWGFLFLTLPCCWCVVVRCPCCCPCWAVLPQDRRCHGWHCLHGTTAAPGPLVRVEKNSSRFVGSLCWPTTPLLQPSPGLPFPHSTSTAHTFSPRPSFSYPRCLRTFSAVPPHRTHPPSNIAVLPKHPRVQGDYLFPHCVNSAHPLSSSCSSRA